MKFTLSILKKFLDTEASLAEIVACLTSIGLEVEEVIDKGNELRDFSVAQIIDASPHPNADKLQICQVQTRDQVLQIVCGAPNARKNIKVVLANVGVVIPNGNFKIKNSEIRGVSSCGMLCSEDELMVGSSSSGIIELPQDAEIGQPFAKYYGFADPVLHINVTPNRGDALSVLGIARDLAASGLGTFNYPIIPTIKESFITDFTVSVEDKQACPLFAIREIHNINPNSTSPEWLKQFLDNVGIGSISAIVDITNYICIAYGQPMHAYDASKISQQLRIRKLTAQAKFSALNDKGYNLEPGDLVIESGDQVQCLAGIIGGKASCVDDKTTKIILEAAHFEAAQVISTGRRTNIESDSRYRFERKINPGFTLTALEIATQLILDICGGDVSNVLSSDNQDSTVKTLSWPIASLEKITGLTIDSAIIISILTKLGFDPKLNNQNIDLKIPSWRHDITIKEDIVEEITRIYGYDDIPEIVLPKTEFKYSVNKNQSLMNDVRRSLAFMGYNEIVSWSFTNSKLSELFTGHKEELFLQNPISADLDYMRPSILPNILQMVAKNINRSFKNQALFEVGPVFKGTLPQDEIVTATGIKYGTNIPKNCHENARQIDPFDIKADLEYVLEFIGISLSKFQLGIASSYFHPTRSASLNLGKNKVAEFGQIHPQILKAFGIDISIMAFELNLSNLPKSKTKFGMRNEYRPSDFQPSIRDFAFIVDIDQPAGEIINYVLNIDKTLIKSVDLFDVYVGNKLPPDKKSLAFSIYIQADRTLNEHDLNSLSDKIISAMTQKFNAVLRYQ